MLHDIRTLPYAVRENDKGRLCIFAPIPNKLFLPEELSAKVLAKMKATAERKLGRPVRQAVVTVPAYFTNAQRKATMAAAQLAGLQLLGLLNEPTAAALAYTWERKLPKRVQFMLI